MQKTKFSRILSVILCVVLVAAMAFFTSGCTDKESLDPTKESAPVFESVTELGEGEKSFSFSVADADGNETVFAVKTDKTIVGEALQELGLLSGDEGPYGLYVKTVNGITYDYDTDGKYWAFYVDGEYAMTGVDSTKITEGAVYAFKAE
jgi:hypothetical protein